MLPNSKANLLPPFSAAVTPEAVQDTIERYPADYAIATVLELSNYLISLCESSTLFGAYSHDPFSPSLKTLHERLHSGYLAPSPLQSNANQEKRTRGAISQRTAKSATNRPLEDFEDLYYAAISRILDIHQTLNVRLGSGFNTLTDVVFPGGPTIAALHESLSQYWDVLNTAQYVKTIDEAVRRSRVKHLHQEILQQVQNDDITQADADELLADLYDPAEYDGVQGLAWIGAWAPSMIGAWLEEKYRIVLSAEREATQTNTKTATRKPKVPKKPTQLSSMKLRRDSLHIPGNSPAADKCNEQAPFESRSESSQSCEMRQSRELQAELDHALEWQIKTQRVEQYSRYLREMASQRARNVVQSTVFNSDMCMGTFGNREDVEMSGV